MPPCLQPVGKDALFSEPRKPLFCFTSQTRKSCPFLKQSLARSQEALVGLDSAAQVQTAGGNKGLNEGAL